MAKDMNVSCPMMDVTQRDKDHGVGYPIDIDSIDHSMPSHGVTSRGKSNAHAHAHAAHGNIGIDPQDGDRRGGGIGKQHSGAAGKMSKTSIKGMKPTADDRRG